MKLNAVLLERVSEYTNISCMLLLLHQMTRDLARIDPAHFIAIDLGVNGGNSTVAMATALMEFYPGPQLHSCDIKPSALAESYIALAGAMAFWHFHLADSVKFSENFKQESIALVFLDTSHEYENTKSEIAAWTPKLKRTGRMLMHDTCSRPAGVGRAFNEFCQEHRDWPAYNIDVECGMGVLVKP